MTEAGGCLLGQCTISVSEAQREAFANVTVHLNTYQVNVLRDMSYEDGLRSYDVQLTGQLERRLPQDKCESTVRFVRALDFQLPHELHNQVRAS